MEHVFCQSLSLPFIASPIPLPPYIRPSQLMRRARCIYKTIVYSRDTDSLLGEYDVRNCLFGRAVSINQWCGSLQAWPALPYTVIKAAIDHFTRAISVGKCHLSSTAIHLGLKVIAYQIKLAGIDQILQINAYLIRVHALSGAKCFSDLGQLGKTAPVRSRRLTSIFITIHVQFCMLLLFGFRSNES